MAGAAELTSSTRDLLAWIADRPRTYAETMEAWRSSCPRHTAWEDALCERLVEVVRGTGADGNGRVTLSVALTPRGRAALASRAS
jgi:hypothetical protein